MNLQNSSFQNPINSTKRTEGKNVTEMQKQRKRSYLHRREKVEEGQQVSSWGAKIKQQERKERQIKYKGFDLVLLF